MAMAANYAMPEVLPSRTTHESNLLYIKVKCCIVPVVPWAYVVEKREPF